MQLYQLMQRYLWLSGRSSRREWWIVHIACLLALTINDGTGGRTFQIPLLWLAIDFLLLWISFTSIEVAPTEMNQAE